MHSSERLRLLVVIPIDRNEERACPIWGFRVFDLRTKREFDFDCWVGKEYLRVVFMFLSLVFKFTEIAVGVGDCFVHEIR